MASASGSPSPRRERGPGGEDPDPDPDPRTLTRREEAFTLYCQGYRSPAIAALFGVPQRTVRSWIAATLQAAADESRTRRDHQLRLAIESQRAIVKAAWHAYDRAARAERLTLEHLQNAVPFNVDDDDTTTLAPGLDPFSASPSPRGRGGQGVRSLPRLPTLGARYLQIVLHAQREIARLSGLYHLPDSFYDPNAGRPMQIVIRREPHLPRAQLVAWTAFREQWDAAHPSDPVPPDHLVFPPDGAPLHDYADPDDPDDPDGDPDDLDDGRDDPDDPTDREEIEDADRVQWAAPAHDHAADPQPAQAGLVTERPVGADSAAGPLEIAAKTATLTPLPSGANVHVTAASTEAPPAAVHPGGPIPPVLLPRFRHRAYSSPLSALHPPDRGAP